MADKRDSDKARRKKWLATGLAASVASVGAVGSNMPRGRTPQPTDLRPDGIEVTHVPERRPVRPDSYARTVQPTDTIKELAATDSGGSGKAAAFGPQPVGLVVDLQPLATHRIALADGGESADLQAIPQIVSGGRKKVELSAIGFDPVNTLPESASAEDIKKLLDSFRTPNGEQFDAFQETDHDRQLEMEQSALTQDDTSLGSVHVSEVADNERLIARLNIGREGSPTHQWFEKLLRSASELKQDIDAKLNTTDPAVSFYKEVTTDPENGKFDKRGFDTLRKLFTLSDKDRVQFARALKQGDMRRARQILNYQTSDELVSPGLYDALRSFAEYIKGSGIDEVERPSFATALSQLANTPTKYRDLKTFDGASAGVKIIRQIPEFLDKQQYAELASRPDHVLGLLGKHLDGKMPRVHSHGDFVYMVDEEYGERVRGGADRALRLVQDNVDRLLGNSNRPGWIDSTDRATNILSVLSFIEMRDWLQSVAIPFSQTAKGNMITKNGENSLLIELRGDREEKNEQLASLFRLIQEMQNCTPIAGGRGGGGHLPIALSDRIEHFHAGASWGAQGGPVGPAMLLAFLAHTRITDPQLKSAMKDSSTGERQPMYLAKPEAVTGVEGVKVSQLMQRGIPRRETVASSR